MTSFESSSRSLSHNHRGRSHHPQANQHYQVYSTANTNANNTTSRQSRKRNVERGNSENIHWPMSDNLHDSPNLQQKYSRLHFNNSSNSGAGLTQSYCLSPATHKVKILTAQITDCARTKTDSTFLLSRKSAPKVIVWRGNSFISGGMEVKRAGSEEGNASEGPNLLSYRIVNQRLCQVDSLLPPRSQTAACCPLRSDPNTIAYRFTFSNEI